MDVLSSFACVMVNDTIDTYIYFKKSVATVVLLNKKIDCCTASKAALVNSSAN